MAVFTFIVKESRGKWTAKQHGGEENLEESATSTFELQRKLVNLALTTAGSNSVSSSFSFVTPTSAVAQVILGGGGGGGGSFVSSGSGAAASSGGAAAAAPVEEEKKEEEKEESDDDMGFSVRLSSKSVVTIFSGLLSLFSKKIFRIRNDIKTEA